VCHYDQANDNDWWVSKMIKKHKSTILDVAWHPNSQLLATACCDFKCRIFSAYMDAVDTPVNSIFGDLGATAFGDLLAEFDASNGWVESVAWSPSGNRLAFAGHDSTVTVVQFNATPDVAPTTQVIRLRNLPETSLIFATDDIIVAGGHSFNPSIFQADDSGKWSFIGSADKKSEKAATTTKTNKFSAARSMWASKVNRGQSGDASKKDDKLWTKHTNAITCIKPYSQNGGGAVKFSTSGLDGNIVVWDLKTLASSFSSLKV
jgi:actin related protein 2/3 complex subunit 1A/1B